MIDGETGWCGCACKALSSSREGEGQHLPALVYLGLDTRQRENAFDWGVSRKDLHGLLAPVRAIERVCWPFSSLSGNPRVFFFVSFLLPLQGKGTTFVVYNDPKLRIFRSDTGGLVVQTKANEVVPV